MVSIENGPNVASPASSSASVRRPGTRALTGQLLRQAQGPGVRPRARRDGGGTATGTCGGRRAGRKDRKSTRLNSSHVKNSYADLCLTKKNITHNRSHK